MTKPKRKPEVIRAPVPAQIVFHATIARPFSDWRDDAVRADLARELAETAVASTAVAKVAGHPRIFVQGVEVSPPVKVVRFLIIPTDDRYIPGGIEEAIWANVRTAPLYARLNPALAELLGAWADASWPGDFLQLPDGTQIFALREAACVADVTRPAFELKPVDPDLQP